MGDLCRKIAQLQGSIAQLKSLIDYAASHGGLDNEQWTLRVLGEVVEQAGQLLTEETLRRAA